MVEIQQSFIVNNGRKKRKSGKTKGNVAKKSRRLVPSGAEGKVKVDKKLRKLFEKRARDYNSDDSEEEGDGEQLHEQGRPIGVKTGFKKKDNDFEDELSDDGEEENQGSEPEEISEDENSRIQPGVTKFTDGIKAFKLAFKKIVNKSGGGEDVLGPVLSAHKKLIAEKLAEEDAEKKAKGEVKKEKHLMAEKRHVKLKMYLDAHEKFLLGVATKGVVKLFNAVNKAQNAQKGLNPSRSKDEKVIKQKRKEAFFSELGKAATKVGGTSKDEAPAWAPLRDNYMLNNPKLNGWDKMQQEHDTNDDFGRMCESDGSSDDE